MDAPATLVWIAPGLPDETQSRSIGSWAQAHSRTLSAPRDEPPPALHLDLTVAEEVERVLDRARDAIAARDGAGVDASLAAAETALRAHPELPQGAWLMAEVERMRSTRWRRVPPTDAAAADRAWTRAEALDGGRVAGVGEASSPAHPEPAKLRLEVTPSEGEVYLDGTPVQAGAGGASEISALAGPHVVVVRWRGTPIWAGWIEAAAGTSIVRAAAPPPPPCSSSDLSRVRLMPTADGVDATGVRCPQWVAALTGGTPGEVRVASCEGDRCGPLLSWRAAAPAQPWSPPPAAHAGGARGGWPAWGTWGVIGAGAAIAIGTGVVLVASGALRSSPPETRFVSGGIKGTVGP
jgi:hypothetical protein